MPTTKKTQKVAFLILLGVLLLAGLYTLYPFLKIVILGIILVTLFYPVHRRYLVWTKGRNNLSAFFSAISVCVFLFVPLMILITLITSQLALIVSFTFPDQGGGWPPFLASYQEKILPLVDKIQSFFNIKLDISYFFQQIAIRFGKLIAQYSPDVLAGTADFFFSFFILIIVLFFLFRDGKIFYNKVIHISPVQDTYERRLAVEIKKTIEGVFFGSFLTGLIQAVLATLGYYFAGIDGFFVWGGITFFMSFLPLVGTGAVLVPLVLYLFLNGDLSQAIFLTIYGSVVIGMVDNLLRPMLIRTSMHSLVLFLAVFGGLAVFGAMGLLLGPIIMALLTATLRIYEMDFAPRSSS